jgi:hypothetical protein
MYIYIYIYPDIPRGEPKIAAQFLSCSEIKLIFVLPTAYDQVWKGSICIIVEFRFVPGNGSMIDLSYTWGTTTKITTRLDHTSNSNIR